MSVEVGGLCLLYGLGSDARRALDEVAGHEEYAEDTQYGQCSGKIPCCFLDEIICAANAHHLVGTAELRGEATAFRLLDEDYSNQQKRNYDGKCYYDYVHFIGLFLFLKLLVYDKFL